MSGWVRVSCSCVQPAHHVCFCLVLSGVFGWVARVFGVRLMQQSHPFILDPPCPVQIVVEMSRASVSVWATSLSGTRGSRQFFLMQLCYQEKARLLAEHAFVRIIPAVDGAVMGGGQPPFECVAVPAAWNRCPCRVTWHTRHAHTRHAHHTTF